MRKNTYICSAESVGYTTTKTYCKRIIALFLVLERMFDRFSKIKGGNASFCLHITEFYEKMLNRVKFGWSANNSNRVRFYGKTVIDGKTITSKKYRDAFSAMEWGKNQLNRDCTGIYCITVGGAHIPINVQFI